MNTIDQIEEILNHPGTGRVEIVPDGSIRYFDESEARPQGPTRILTLEQALGDYY